MIFPSSLVTAGRLHLHDADSWIVGRSFFQIVRKGFFRVASKYDLSKSGSDMEVKD